MDLDLLTPVQRRIAALLADGLPHPRESVRQCLFDTDGHVSNVQPHISAIRKRLLPLGQTIICEIVSRRICYRQIRLLTAPQDLA